MKIGIMGGTFDPIHNRHRDIALCAREEYGLDQIWFMPAGDPYCKEDKQVTPAAIRLEMTEAAVAEMPEFCRCSDIEVMTPGRTYTANTLRRLRELYPDDSFYFIAGADSILYMDSWYEPEEIFRNAIVLCAERPGSEDELTETIAFLNDKYQRFGKERVRLIHCGEEPVSSTDIRSMHERGGDISPYVAKGVLDLIERYGLYREPNKG